MSESAATAYEVLRAADDRDGGLPVKAREKLLTRLERATIDARDAIAAAIDGDFGGRSREETLVAEVLVTVNAIRHIRPRIARWAKPRRVAVGLPFWPSRAWEVLQPLGVVGVLSPWNYPFQLAVLPLVSALAAGNRVMLKPSELAPRTADLLGDLLNDALGPEVVQVVTGGADVAEAFTQLPFDHLFFTGSTQTGRRVMAAAAENLTPVTLELGGKCPVVVMPDADLRETARSVVMGKGLNAGQTCIAPDTVLLVGVSRETFEAALRESAARHYPNGLPTGIASFRHKARLDAILAGAEVEPLTSVGQGERPGQLIITSIHPGSERSREEIFGPILAVETMASLDEAMSWIRARPSPLAIYLFTRSRETERRFLDSSRAGALVVNGTVIQAAVDGLPFGGVGTSGIGRYHGRAGFETFSNRKSYMRASRLSLARLLDPPYTERTRALLARLFR
jgi:acyl-CoA reductase-like NAD-dependent aldehyde dehydrogenase